MLDTVQSYISASAKSTESFDEYYTRYMMKVQDEHLDMEMNKLFRSSNFQKLIDLDKEANKLHTNVLRGV